MPSYSMDANGWRLDFLPPSFLLTTHPSPILSPPQTSPNDAIYPPSKNPGTPSNVRRDGRSFHTQPQAEHAYPAYSKACCEVCGPSLEDLTLRRTTYSALGSTQCHQ